jgi:UV DNA damage endonuclease
MEIHKRIGYCCINLELQGSDGISTNRHIIKKTFDAQKETNEVVSRLALQNVKDLVKIIQWNERKGIKFFRMSSNMFPWMSEYELKSLPDWPMIEKNLLLAGSLATKYNQRLEMHPGPFNVLGSSNGFVVRKTVKELDQHAEIFDAMGFEPSHWNQINIHLNTTQGGKEECAKRFIKGFNKLHPNTQARLVIENDDKPSQYSVKDLYELLYKEIQIPITFDSHHHKFCSGNLTHEEAAKLASSTWGNVPAGFHFSSTINHESPDQMARAHADWIYEEITDWGTGAWIMVEAKLKERAIIKYINEGIMPSEYEEKYNLINEQEILL